MLSKSFGKKTWVGTCFRESMWLLMTINYLSYCGIHCIRVDL
jgi:hypothetical protein